MKTKKILKWGCCSLAALFVIAIIVLFSMLTRDNDIATDPSRIADEAGFDLPDYTVVNQYDNMDRGASAWSSYEWELVLNEPLKEKDLKKLDHLVDKDPNWSYSEETRTYSYHLNEDGERYFTIVINANDGKVNMDYSWWDFLS